MSESGASDGFPAARIRSTALQIQNQLWDRVRRFYKQVRNPLFHGCQLHCPTEDQNIPRSAVLATVPDTFPNVVSRNRMV
jgi:hypothetical protein